VGNRWSDYRLPYSLSVAKRRFDVYGLGIAVDGDWIDVVDALAADLAWFERDAGHIDVEIHVERGEPDYDAYGELDASFVTERNVVYHSGERTIIDYLGRAVSILEGGRARIVGTDARFARRAGFDFVLGRIGDHLDARRMPRLHGLGLSGAQGGVVVMLPSGGGKTTLALRALREDGVRFLSEGSPVLDAEGRLHPLPFPL
jgi:hypothetical protein